MLKFEKERIIFPYILYINFFGKFYDSYILFIDKNQTNLSKLKKIFQKFARKKNFSYLCSENQKFE